MEVAERRVRDARVRLDVYRKLRDGVSDAPVDTATWHEKRRYDAMVQAIEEVFEDLGIECD